MSTTETKQSHTTKSTKSHATKSKRFNVKAAVGLLLAATLIAPAIGLAAGGEADDETPNPRTITVTKVWDGDKTDEYDFSALRKEPTMHLSPLLTGYTQLEYIEANDTNASSQKQYIDLGFKFKDSYRIVADFQFTNSDLGAGYRFTGDQTNNSRMFRFGTFGSSSELYWYPRYDSQSAGTTDIKLEGKTTRHTVSLGRDSSNAAYVNFIVDDVTKKVFNYSKFGETQENAYIFLLHDGKTVKDWAPAKLYSYKIFDVDDSGKETLVYDFIPVEKNDTKRVGLYDLVNKKFYDCVGSGNFTAGPAVQQDDNSQYDLVLKPKFTSKATAWNTDTWTYEFKDLPDDDLVYEVYENDAALTYYGCENNRVTIKTQELDGRDVPIVNYRDDEKDKATITNKLETRTLTVKKNVIGSDNSKKTKFPITLKVTVPGLPEENKSWTTIKYEGGKLEDNPDTLEFTGEEGLRTIYLKNGQSFSVTLPEGAQYTLSEPNDPDFIESYKVNDDDSVEDCSVNSRTLKDDAEVTFTNTEAVNVTVAKKWDGTPLQDVNIELLQWTGNNAPVSLLDEKPVIGEGQWQALGENYHHTYEAQFDYSGDKQNSYRFPTLPAYDANGKPIYYCAYETTKVEYFDTAYSKDGNTYVVTNKNNFNVAGSALVQVSKSIVGRPLRASDEYRFQIKPFGTNATDAPTPKPLSNPDDTGDYTTATASSTTAGVANFEPLKFSTDNAEDNATYTYELSEIIPGEAKATINGEQKTYSDTSISPEDRKSAEWKYEGMEYSTDTYTATVTYSVTSGEGGKQDVTVNVHYSQADGSDLPLDMPVPRFTNTYNVAGSVQIPITKRVPGYSGETGDAFTFKVEPMYGAPEPEGEGKVILDYNNVESGEKTIPSPKIPIRLSNLTQVDSDGALYGQFVYKITEEEGTGLTSSRFAHDDSEIYVRLTVKDNGNGTLSEPEYEYFSDPRFREADKIDANSALFTNSLVRTVNVTKVWQGVPNADVSIRLQQAEFTRSEFDKFKNAEKASDSDNETKEGYYKVKVGGDDYWVEEGCFPAQLDGTTVKQVPDSRWTDTGKSVTMSSRDFDNPASTSSEENTATKTVRFSNMPINSTGSGTDVKYVVYRAVEDEAQDEEYETHYAVTWDDSSVANSRLTLTVTNVSKFNESGTARIDAIKDLQGRAWKASGDRGDSFVFDLAPLGKAKFESSNKTLERPLVGNALDETKLETGDIPVPKDDEDEDKDDLEASAVDTEDSYVSSTQRQATFNDITYTQDDLVRTANGTWENYFYYQLTEHIRDDYLALEKIGENDPIPERYFNVSGTLYKVLDNVKFESGKTDRTAYDYWLDPGTGIAYSSDEHIVQVHVKLVGSALTTEVSYDGNSAGSTSPVFTNYYDADGLDTAVIVKHIAGRDWNADDKFRFYIRAVGGAIMDPVTTGTVALDTDLDAGKVADADTWITAAAYKGSQTVDGSNSDSEDRAILTGSSYYHLDELTPATTTDLDKNTVKGRMEGWFVHAITEIADDSVLVNGEEEAWYKADDLKYDDSTIYMQTHVWDNGDGTLSNEHRYYSDATCRNEITGHTVWVDENGNPAGTDALGSDAAKIASEGSFTHNGKTYKQVNAAYFENAHVTDIPITKTWVDEDNKVVAPTEDVVVELYRYAVAMDENGNPITTDLPDSSTAAGWERVDTVMFDRDSFMYTAEEAMQHNESGAEADQVKMGDLKPAGAVVKTIENVDLFQKQSDGSLKRYVFRVREATQSNAYETTYALTDANGVVAGGDNPYGAAVDATLTTTSGGFALRNELVATDTANLSAAKQLVGREWQGGQGEGDDKDIDRYSFTLTPIGMGTYYPDTTEGENGHTMGDLIAPATFENGETKWANSAFVQTGTGDAATPDTTRVPMPSSHVSSELKGENANKQAMAANYTKFVGDTIAPTIEKVGEGERLARFGGITFDLTQLVRNGQTGAMQGDFFYEMREDIPVGAKSTEHDLTYGSGTTQEQRDNHTWVHKGVTYDSTVHTVHIEVRENRTSKLAVRIGYDEEMPGDVTSGSQFTPVFTNRYGAEGTGAVGLKKYVLGGKINEGDTFDFELHPMGGSQFVAADYDDIAYATDGGFETRIPGQDPQAIADATEDNLLAGGKNVTTSSGGVKARLTATDATDENGSATMDFAEMKWTLDDLNLTVPEGNSSVKYEDGTAVPAGMRYGVFYYAINEVGTSRGDLVMDGGTEYVQVTAIDRGDGTIDLGMAAFEDRYGNNMWVTDGSNKDAENRLIDEKIVAKASAGSLPPATRAPFVNSATAKLKVVKEWDGYAHTDAEVTLLRTTKAGMNDGDVTKMGNEQDLAYEGDRPRTDESAGWVVMEGTSYDHTFLPGASGEGLEWTIEGLPRYDNQGKTYTYRVVEEDLVKVGGDGTARYVKKEGGKEAFELVGYEAETKTATTPATDDAPETSETLRVLTVTNKSNYSATLGSASIDVTKALAGRDWIDKASDPNNDTGRYEFRITPKGVFQWGLNSQKSLNEGVANRMPLPDGAAENASSATAAASTKVTDNSYKATFKFSAEGHQFTNDLLAKNPTTNVFEGDFVYTITEVVPDDAIAYVVNDDGSLATPKDDDGEDLALKYSDANDAQKQQYAWVHKGVRYNATTHDAFVHVTNSSTGLSYTVTFDDEVSGESDATPSWARGADTLIMTNTYDAKATTAGHVIKRIDGRAWRDSDEDDADNFVFLVEPVSDATVRETGSGRGESTPASSGAAAGTSGIGHLEGQNWYTPVMKSGEKSGDGGASRAMVTGRGTFQLSDLKADGKGRFIYAITEVDPDADSVLDAWTDFEKVPDLDYDTSSTVYLCIDVWDNHDGTLGWTNSYYTNAACTKPLKKPDGSEPVVWVDESGDLVNQPTGLDALDPKPSPKADAAGERHDTVWVDEAGKALAYVAADVDKPTGADKAVTCMQAAFFENTLKADIAVEKTWVGTPVEDVSLRLLRAEVDPDMTEEAASGVDASNFKTVGYSYVMPRAYFLKDDGSQLTEVTAGADGADSDGYVPLDSQEYGIPEGVRAWRKVGTQGTGNDKKMAVTVKVLVPGFNRDVPLFLRDSKGTSKRAIYKLVEDDTSDSYKPEYDDDLFYNDGTVHVTNETTATNTANIAAVKQLMNRTWAAKDAFKFKLEAIGAADYWSASDTGHDEGEIKTKGEGGNEVVLKDGVTPKLPAEAVGVDTGAGDAVALGTSEAAATSETPTVAVGEHLARFGEIAYTVDDLVYDGADRHHQGDFFYRMYEEVPGDAKAVNADGDYVGENDAKVDSAGDALIYSKASAAQKEACSWKGERGITYSGKVCVVHVKVRENRTSQLQVQVSYDDYDYDCESRKLTPSGSSASTQSTPVFTNYYAAEGATTADGEKTSVKVWKQKLGGTWTKGHYYDFVMQPLGGAPWADADPAEFAEGDKMETPQDGKDGKPDSEHAVHTAEGQHKIRMAIGQELDGESGKDKPQTKAFPTLKFTLDDLHKQVKTAGELQYSNSTYVPVGVKYGQFDYAIEEVQGEFKDIEYDHDTEYARITVIDNEDGTLDVSVKYYQDRAFLVERKVADGGGAPFTNAALHTVYVQKDWDGIPDEDVTVHLQRAAIETGAKEYSGTESNGKTVEVAGKTCTVVELGDKKYLVDTWTEVGTTVFYKSEFQSTPVVKHQFPGMLSESASTDAAGNIHYYTYVYRIVEDDAHNQSQDGQKSFIKTYPHQISSGNGSSEEFGTSGNPLEVRNTSAYKATGEATVNVVKQLVGRDWMRSDDFEFVIEPKGLGQYYTEEGADAYNKDKDAESRVKAGDLKLTPAGEYDLIADDSAKAKVADSISTAEGGNIGHARPTANTVVSENEHSVIFEKLNFKDVSATSADSVLKRHPLTGVFRADYFYTVRERIANGAVALEFVGGREAADPSTEQRLINGTVYRITEDTYDAHKDDKDDDGKPKYTYWLNRGNGVIYTSEEHTVRVHLEDNGAGGVTTQVSYDDRESGSFVPVFTNRYDAAVGVNLNVRKHIVGGNDGSYDGKYRFELLPMPGAPWGVGVDALRTTVEIEGGERDGASNFGEQGDYKSKGYYYLSDLNGASEGDFVYAIHEVDPADPSTYKATKIKDDDGGDTEEVVSLHEGGTVDGDAITHKDNLSYDPRTLYVKVHLKDESKNGKLSYTLSYYDDPTCTEEHLLETTGSSADPDNFKESAAAQFNNAPTRSVKVQKVWADKVPLRNSTIRLQRYPAVDGTAKWEDVSTAPLTFRTTEPYTDGKSTPKEFEGLPASYVDAQGNEKAVQYRVVEDDATSGGFSVKYSALNGYGNSGEGSGVEKLTFDDGADKNLAAGDAVLPANGTLVVTNSYAATGSAKVVAVKQLLGRKWIAGDSFDFRLKSVGKATEYNENGTLNIEYADVKVPMPGDTAITTRSDVGATKNASYGNGTPAKNTTTLVADNEHLATFADIQFNRNDLIMGPNGLLQGDFFYELSEVEPGDAIDHVFNGVTYSDKTAEVHIHVQDDLTGHLTTAVYYGETTQGDPTTAQDFTPVFTNTYDATYNVSIPVAKHIAQRAMVDGEKFEFTLTPMGGALMPFDGDSQLRKESLAAEITHSSPSVTKDGVDDRYAKFEAIPIRLADLTDDGTGKLTGRFLYRINEVGAGSVKDGLRYDDQEIYALVTVSKAANSDAMEATIDYYSSASCADGTLVNSKMLSVPVDARGLTVDEADGVAAATFTNVEQRQVYVRKTWKGEPTQDVTVEVRRSGESGTPVSTLTFVAANCAKAPNRALTEHTGTLDKYDAEGNLIEYVANEVVPENADFSVEGDGGKTTSGKGESGDPVELTNTNKATVAIEGAKVWIDPLSTNSAANWRRPNNAELKLTLHRKAGSTGEEQTIELFGEGSSNQDGAVTRTVGTETFALTWEGDAYSIAGARVNDDRGDAYEYWVTEGGVGENYDPARYATAEGADQLTGAPSGGTITNKVKQKYAPITVRKHWNDDNNREGMRPDNVTLHLYADGTDLVATLVSEDDSTHDPDNWTYSFKPESGAGAGEGYPVFGDDGHYIEYLVREDPSVRRYHSPAYYKDQNEGTEMPTQPLPASALGAPNGGTIVNTYEPDLLTVSGTKTWEFEGLSEAQRPTGAKVYLQRRDLGSTNDADWKYVKESDKTPLESKSEAWSFNVGATDDLTYTFTGLPRYKEKESSSKPSVELEYRVVDEMLGGSTEVNKKFKASGGTEDSGYDLVNTYTPDPVELQGTHYINVQKILVDTQGKEIATDEWAANDYAFAFSLTPDDPNNPMPEDSIAGEKQIVVDKDSKRTIYSDPDKGTVDTRDAPHTATFGAIEFAKPGEYYYTVKEVSPSEVWATLADQVKVFPGITYNVTQFYTAKVTVKADGDKLKISDVLLRGDRNGEPVTNLTATVTNTYDPSAKTYSMEARKDYVDREPETQGHSNRLEDNRFRFTLRPIDSEGDGKPATDAPMPEKKYDPATGVGLQGEGADRVYYAKNTGDIVFFEERSDGLRFTQDNPGVYAYEIAEVIPDNAQYIGNGYWRDPADGVVYDGTVHKRRITSAMTGESPNQVLTVEASELGDYYHDPDKGVLHKDLPADSPTVAISDGSASDFKERHQGSHDIPKFRNYREPLTSISVTKEWDDDANRDGVRPYSVTMKLQRHVADSEPTDVAKDALGNAVATRTVLGTAKAGDLVVSWNNLPKYDAEKREYIYTVVETGYKAKESDAADSADFTAIDYSRSYKDGDGGPVTHQSYGAPDGGTVTNSHAPAQGEITATKVWADDGNRDKRRTDVTLRLYKRVAATGADAGTSQLRAVDAEPKTVATGNDHSSDMTAVWSNLPFYENGQKVKYVVVEDAVPGYSSEVKYPEVQGVDSPDYVELTSSVEAAKVTVTNTREHFDEAPDISVAKEWDDAGDVDGVRSTSVVVELWANGVPARDSNDNPITLELKASENPDNNWKGTFTGLPANNATGAIAYTVHEKAGSYPESYKSGVDGSVSKGFTIINSRQADTISVAVSKTWDDENDRDGVRPESVTVRLYANGEDTGKTLVLRASGDSDADWKGVFADLPKRAWVDEEGVDKRKLVEYTVEEESVQALANAGYNLDVAGKYASPEAEKVSDNEWKFTNTRTPDTTSVTLTKTWEDGNDADGLRPSTAEYGAKVHLYRNAGDDAATEYTAATPTVVDNLDGTYTVTWSGLPANAPKDDAAESPKAYTYTVAEDWIRGYEPDGEKQGEAPSAIYWAKGSAATGFTLENKHVPTNVSVTLTKTWVGDADLLGVRPSEDEFKGMLTLTAGNKDVTAKYAGNLSVTAGEGTSSNTYRATWTNLPEYENGSKISYSVTETLPADSPYEASSPSDDATSKGTSLTVPVAFADDGKAGAAAIANTLQDGFETTAFTVRKVWVDRVYQDDRAVQPANPERPDSVKLTINGEAGSAVIEPTEVTLTKSGDASGTDQDVWERTVELPRFAQVGTEDGKPKYEEITYAVEEAEADVPANYLASVLYGNTVVNTYQMTTFKGTKAWVDGGRPHDNAREVKLTLWRKTADAGWVEVEDPHLDWNGGSFTFIGLPAKDAHGEPFTYSVTEEKVGAGYANPTYANTGGNSSETDRLYDGGTVTNKLAESKVAVSGKKTWVDGGKSHDNASEVTLTLTRTSAKGGSPTVNVTATPEWSGNTYTFGNLDAIDAEGYAYTYEVRETPVEGYTTAQDGYDLTNTLVAAEATVTGTVEWRDAAGSPHVSEDESTLVLYRTSAKAGSSPEVVNGASPTWSGDAYTFGNLPALDEGGYAYTYHVEEKHVPGFTTTYSDAAGAPSGSNAPTGGKVVNVSEDGSMPVQVKVKWSDDDNHDGKRPQSVTVGLYESGSDAPVETITVTADDNWTALFKDKPLNKDGQPITYTVKQESYVDADGTTRTDFGNIDYTAPTEPSGDQAAGFWFTNAAANGTLNVTAEKKWADEGNSLAKRADVTFELRGTTESGWMTVDTKKAATGVDHTEQMSVTWTVPAYHNGEEVAYEVSERAVPGYSCTRQDVSEDSHHKHYVFTNTPVESSQSLTVEKTWVDGNNRDGKRMNTKLVLQYSTDGGQEWHDVEPGLVQNAALAVEGSGKAADQKTAVEIDGANSTGDGKVTATWTLLPTDPAALGTQDDDSDDDDSTGAGEPGVGGQSVDGDAQSDAAEGELPEGDAAGTGEGAAGDEGAGDGSAAATDSGAAADSDGSQEAAQPADADGDGAGDQAGQDGEASAQGDGFPLVEQAYAADGDAAGPIIYRVVERDASGKDANADGSAVKAAGYTAVVAQTGNSKFEVYNVHAPETRNVQVSKAWSDEGKPAGIERPSSVDVQLVAGSEKLGDPVALDDSNDWQHTWTDLFKYEGGAEIDYTVDEGSVPDGYAKSIAESADGDTKVFAITNTYSDDAARTDVTVTKSWLSKQGDEIAPGSGVETPEVTLRLMQSFSGSLEQEPVAGAEAFAVPSASGATADQMTHTWKDLPEISGGKRVNYTVVEETTETIAYRQERVSQEGDSYRIVNKLKVNRYDPTNPDGPGYSGNDDPEKLIKVTYVDHLLGENGNGGDLTDGKEVVSAVKAKAGDVNAAVLKNVGVQYTANGVTDMNGEAKLQAQAKAQAQLAAQAADGDAADAADGGADEAAGTVAPQAAEADAAGTDAASDGAGDGAAEAGDVAGAVRAQAAAADVGGAFSVPADPESASHKGYVFAGWTMNKDEFGDYTMVAHHKQVKTVVVSYVDPLAKSKLVTSQRTSDPDSVAAPDDPSHKGYAFKGWTRTVDEAGNVIFVAVYKSNSSGSAGTSDDSDDDPRIVVYPRGTSRSPALATQGSGPLFGLLPSTGDPAADMMYSYGLVAVLAALLAALSGWMYARRTAPAAAAAGPAGRRGFLERRRRASEGDASGSGEGEGRTGAIAAGLVTVAHRAKDGAARARAAAAERMADTAHEYNREGLSERFGRHGSSDFDIPRGPDRSNGDDLFG